MWISTFWPPGLHRGRNSGPFDAWDAQRVLHSTRCPLWCPCCVYGPCPTPVSGQYAVGESELASSRRGRCSAAGVDDLGARGHRGQCRPGFGARETHFGTRLAPTHTERTSRGPGPGCMQLRTRPLVPYTTNVTRPPPHWPRCFRA